MLNWLLALEGADMLQTVSRLLPELPLFLMIAVATHLVMSFAQTLLHYKFGHHPMGGKFFRNHINFHHTYYSKDHLVSRAYRGDRTSLLQSRTELEVITPAAIAGGKAGLVLCQVAGQYSGQ
jgi:hypothetical protein